MRWKGSPAAPARPLLSVAFSEYANGGRSRHSKRVRRGALDHVEEIEKDDDRDRNSEQPEQDAAHEDLP